MFKLPTPGTLARDLLGDLEHVAELLHPDKRADLPTFGRAVMRGRRFMMENKAAKHIAIICHGNCNKPSQNGQIVLITVGRRGGHKLQWVFGPC